MWLAKLIIKSLGKEFYRLNTAFLITSIVLVLGYGIFIKTAGHIYDPEQFKTINFSLLAYFTETPLIFMLVAVLWFFYALKSWKFVWNISTREDQLFWRYSITAMPLLKQFLHWFVYQLFIFIPLIVYWLITLTYGLLTGHYLIPLMTGVYLLLLTLVSAGLYVYQYNVAVFGKGISYPRWLNKMAWRKPLFSAFLFEILLHGYWAFLLCKSISILLIVGYTGLFADADYPWRVVTVLSLTVALTHAVLAYRDYGFTEKYLGFARLLPYRRLDGYGSMLLTYTLLLLPEVIWFACVIPPAVATQSIGLCLSVLMLIRCGVLLYGLYIRQFLKGLFCMYFIAVLFLLYDLGWLLILLNITLSITIYFYTYYRRETTLIR